MMVSSGEDIRCVQFEFTWKRSLHTPIVAPYADVGAYQLLTESEQQLKCMIKVFVQGDLLLQDAGGSTAESVEKKPVFITVHDVGKSYLSFVELANNPAITPFRERGAVFLHIKCLDKSPVRRTFAERDALAQMMEKLKLRKCIAIGEGAGADVVSRFAMNHPQLLVGSVLIHCTSTTHGIIAYIKELFTNLRLEDGIMTQSAWNWLLVHEFGNHNMDHEENRNYVNAIKASGMNERNLSRYLYAFSDRDDFTDRLADQLAKVDVLLVTGGRAPQNENVQHMFKHMHKPKSGLLVAEDVVDVLAEVPEYVAGALIFLCQRHGIFMDMQLPAVAKLNSPEGISFQNDHWVHHLAEPEILASMNVQKLFNDQ